MDYLETPACRFEGLSDYPFEAHFIEVDGAGLRMHYVDEGPKDGPLVLMLHGEPSWSYLYRFMIPKVAAAGMRVIAPDLIGFGKSSKPTHFEDYSYARHCRWLRHFIEGLDLREMTLFAQDWGSLLGLRLVTQMDARFARVLIGNGFLPTGDPPAQMLDALGNMSAFMLWRTFSQYSPWFVMSRVLQLGTARTLSNAELRAYDAPFPDRRYLAGARAFPALVPIVPWGPARAANLAAWEALEQWNKPFETAFSTGDPIMRGLDRILQKRIPGAQGRNHERVRGGHFLQEDSPDELSERIIALVNAG